MYGGNGMISNCLISGNAAVDLGGGAYAGTVNNCTINGNTAYSGGGTSGGTVNNCTISGNAAKQRGGGVYYGTVINSIVWENTAPTSNNMFNSSAAYTCSDPRPAGIWNICADPLFVNTNAGNYRLQEGSPCINAGTNLPWMVGATDLDGNPRIIDGRVDMGAYEFVPEPTLIRQVMLIALGTLGRKRRVRQASAVD